MILADENLPFSIQKALAKDGIEVYSIAKNHSGISDAEVIELSKEPRRIILTEDKDFGEWVYAHKEKDVSVIFLRYEHADMARITEILVDLVKQKKADLFGKFTTITIDKIRIRKI
jgi:predicted nuclease of predicted toxin-antitoxin system